MPPGLKRRGSLGKRVLRMSMEGKLPETILRRPKQGFNVPNAQWFRGDLREFTQDHLAPQRIGAMGFLDAREVQRLLSEHDERRADHSHQLWGLLTLALWTDQFLSNGGS